MTIVHHDYEVCEWDGRERRGVDGITLQLMAEVRATMEKHEHLEEIKFVELKDAIEENRRQSEARHDDLAHRFDSMQQSTMNLLQANNHTTQEIHRLFKAAFPDGDAEGHRKAHEHWIKKEQEDREFWLKLKQHVINWVVVAALGWGGIIIWAAFVQGPKG